MKTHATNSWLLVLLLASAGLCLSGFVRADDLKLRAEADAKGQTFRVRSGSSDSNPFGGGFAPAAAIRTRMNQASAIRQAAEAVHAAKGEEAKSDAQKKLTKLLNEAYDMDMTEREKELKQIEERLTKLRELLERRRAKKQDIIDLQVKVALNEAEGLGFSDLDRLKRGPGNMSYITIDGPSTSTIMPGAPVPVTPPTPPNPPIDAQLPH